MTRVVPDSYRLKPPPVATPEHYTGILVTSVGSSPRDSSAQFNSRHLVVRCHWATTGRICSQGTVVTTAEALTPAVPSRGRFQPSPVCIPIEVTTLAG